MEGNTTGLQARLSMFQSELDQAEKKCIIASSRHFKELADYEFNDRQRRP